MNIIRNQSTRSGGVLIVALCVIAVGAIVLGSYLVLIQNQSASVARSQNWNSIIAVSEAGIEEGLALVNTGAPAIMSNPMNWTNTLSTNGWSALTTNKTSLTRYVSGSNYYTVSVDITSGSPVITSVGIVPYTSIPWAFSSARSPVVAAVGFRPFLAQTGGGVTTANLGRKIQVQTTLNPLFTMGMMAKNAITFSGNVLLDSFNSSNPSYSTGGKYDATKHEANCALGSDSDVVNAISGSGNVKIYGSIHTGPTGGYSFSGNDQIGDLAFVNAGTTGVEAGHFSQDMNMSFPDVPTPTAGSWTAPAGGTVNGTAYTYVLSANNGNYTLASINLSGNNAIMVSGKNVTLYVPGTISISGNSSITIASNASVAVYVGGASATFSGNGVVNAGNANQFAYYGLKNNTSISYSGNTGLIGTVYAPEAAYTMSGNSDYVGASVTLSVTKSGNSNFHYDEALGTIGPAQGWIAKNWTELKYP